MLYSYTMSRADRTTLILSVQKPKLKLVNWEVGITCGLNIFWFGRVSERVNNFETLCFLN